jgi:hypothetical protein
MRDQQKRRGRLYLVAIAAGIALGVALAVAGGALIGLSQRQDDIERLAAEIQQSRIESVLISCREQNQKHDATIETLDSVLDSARQGASSERREQIDRSRQSTVLLIDALAPKRGCELRARTLVGSVGRPSSSK